MTLSHTPSMPWVPSHRYLWLGIGLSLAIHAALLALRFTPPEQPPAPPHLNLEVVLLNLVTQDAPERVQALAQTASAGGGTQESGLARSPLPAWQAAAQLPQPAAPEASTTSPTPETTAAPRELLTRNASTEVAPAEANTPAPVPPAQAPAPPPQTMPSEPTTAPEAQALIARLTQQYAAISQRLEEASQRPRQHYFAPSTSPWAFAEYVEQWRDAVETWGNRHYPPQLRGRLYGSLQLTVRIRADGTLASIELDTPSIHPELNDAARLIVQRAAPFAPFPDAIRREAEILSITRTWHFENDALRTQTP